MTMGAEDDRGGRGAVTDDHGHGHDRDPTVIVAAIVTVTVRYLPPQTITSRAPD